MTFSYSAIWNDTMAMMRAHASLMAAIAGVFIFLPSLLLSYLVPAPQQDPSMQLMIDHFLSNLHWYILAQLASMVGAIAILTLVFRRDGVSVADAIGNGFVMLPFYFLALLIARVTIGIGLIALIVPGLYLIGRLAPVGPIVVAERLRNPIEAFSRSFRLTRGRGWASFGLIFLVAVAGLVVVIAVSSVVGILVMVGGGGVGRLLALIANSAISTAFAVVLILLFAAIYRALAGAESPARAVD